MTTKAFLAGALTSASIALVIQYALEQTRKKQTKQRKHKPRSMPPAALDTAPEQEPELLMDSPLLDQRMIRKAEGAILKRTSRVTIVVERCTNDHNYSAILRTAEALGVQHVWIISPPPVCTDGVEHISKTGHVVQSTEQEAKERQMHHLFARKATEWLTVREFDTTEECITALRETQHTIWATDLSQHAVCLTKEALTAHYSDNDDIATSIMPAKLAIAFGTEAVGCTEELLQASDLRVYLPLRGFADSLNLSVAAALVLHQLYTLDPTIEGGMSEEERTQLRDKWFTKLASQRMLSAASKKTRGLLEGKITACQRLQEKELAGHSLQDGQMKKLALMAHHQAELNAIDQEMERMARLAVKDLIENPPAPITDMRRADEHRTCYVGKNTKAKYDGMWDGMPATTNYHSEQGSSAIFFRQRAGMDVSGLTLGNNAKEPTGSAAGFSN
jgi:tRNA G18 (ribose-2'-O)-methylase SpoU